MNNETDSKKKPTTEQRRAMAKLAEELFTQGIEQARDEEGALASEITGELRQELGVNALDLKIDSLESQVKVLEKKKETLGWSRYDGFLSNSKAGRMLKGRVAKRSSSVRDLEKQRKRVLSSIWTCDTVEELNRIVGEL